ncbi:FecR protein [Rosistilla ulvae]|uniref:FecR protein n=1 Tax=Rosistilla ulvae TaxID=1930277 RepID=A0A517M464_9BACT|nr:LamG-like jellyroll fold domain-containing protein [Rosistilla ulvae]QDS89658.1 FecR protein [Rosistilla ulvae]
MNEHTFDELLSQFLDDAIGDEDLDRLGKMIAGDESLRQRYREEVQMAEALAMVAGEDRSAELFAERLDQRLEAESQKFDFLNRVLNRSGKLAERSVIRRWAPIVAGALAASIVIAFGAGLSTGLWQGRHSAPSIANAAGGQLPEPPQPAVIPQEPVDDSVAILKQVVDVTWTGTNQYEVGDSVSPREIIELESGLVQMQFFRGATLTLEGPARLEINAPDQVMLHSGQAWAQVPVPARGFTVLTSETKIVDLGTEFGVSATPGQRTEVRVFDGLVELYEPASKPDGDMLHSLETGQAISVDVQGRSTPLSDQVTAMPSELLLREKRSQQIREGYRRWQRWSEEFRDDPRLLLYYNFESPDATTSTLRNQASDTRKLDGAVVGGAWTQGRWPQKGALDFKRPSDRVRFHVAGDFESLTLAAWVRVDGLDRMLSSLLLTDQWDNGEVHWQFDQLGQLGLSVGGAPDVKWRYTQPLVDLTQLGQWIHVASVFDGGRQTVRHYFNGQRVGDEESLQFDGRLRIGNAELGNWGRPQWQGSQAIRNFNGRMDEFILIDGALQDAEILEIYETGNPNR